MSEPFFLHPQILADTFSVADLDLSALRLMNCSALPWLILVPRRAGISETTELSVTDQNMLMAEIALTSRLLRGLFDPRRINVAALGNVVPQLHVHVIARSENDGAWPKPVWGNVPMDPYSTDEQSEMLALLRSALANR